MLTLKRSEWALLIGLLLLSLVPCVGGILRLVEMLGGLHVLPENTRIQAMPVPAIIHLTTSIPYCLLGILQFLPSVRSAHPEWHRGSGRFLALAGLLSAISGLWLTHFYGFPEELQGLLLYWVRLAVSFGMILSIVLGISAILKKRISTHKAWMTRAYALGQGAGTQVFVVISWQLIVGEPSGLTRDLLMTFAWGVNLYVAQIAIWGSWKRRNRRIG